MKFTVPGFEPTTIYNNPRLGSSPSVANVYVVIVLNLKQLNWWSVIQ